MVFGHFSFDLKWPDTLVWVALASPCCTPMLAQKEVSIFVSRQKICILSFGEPFPRPMEGRSAPAHAKKTYCYDHPC